MLRESRVVSRRRELSLSFSSLSLVGRKGNPSRAIVLTCGRFTWRFWIQGIAPLSRKEGS
jgi:hypothetical protein